MTSSFVALQGLGDIIDLAYMAPDRADFSVSTVNYDANWWTSEFTYVGEPSIGTTVILTIN